MEAAKAAASEEVEQIRKLLTSSAAAKAELEAKVARAAGALKAADELREARCCFLCKEAITSHSTLTKARLHQCIFRMEIKLVDLSAPWVLILCYMPMENIRHCNVYYKSDAKKVVCAVRRHGVRNMLSYPDRCAVLPRTGRSTRRRP